MNQITIDKQRVKKWQSEQKAFLKSQDSALVFGDKRQFNKTTQFVSTTKKDYPRHDLIPREKLKKKDSSDENRLKMDFSNNLQQSLSSASYPSYYIDQEKKDGTLLTFKNHQLEATRIATKAKLDRVDIGDKSLTSYLSINQATYQGKQLKQSPQDISEAIRRAAEIADYNLKGITRRKINLNEPVSSNIPQGDRNKPHCYLSTSIINFVAPASKNYATRVKKVELLTDIFPGDRKQDYETTNAQTFLRHQQFPIKVNPKKAVTNVFLGDQVRGPLIQAQETKKLQSIHQKDFAISQLTPTIPIKHSTFSTKKGVKDAINPANSLYQPDPIKVPVNEKQHDGDIDVNDERKFNNTKSCVPFGDFVYFDVKDHQSISHGTFIKFEQNHKPIIVKIHKNHSQFEFGYDKVNHYQSINKSTYSPKLNIPKLRTPKLPLTRIYDADPGLPMQTSTAHDHYTGLFNERATALIPQKNVGRKLLFPVDRIQDTRGFTTTTGDGYCLREGIIDIIIPLSAKK